MVYLSNFYQEYESILGFVLFSFNMSFSEIITPLFLGIHVILPTQK